MISEKPGKAHFRELYKTFSSPIAELDCGQMCGPYNDYGVPVCCDIKQVIPAAYQEEWAYLQENCDLWCPWRGADRKEQDELMNSLQGGQVLIQCLGYQDCQRSFRSISCRAFPFYPYIDSSSNFIGLAYYRDFQEECWVISNLALVSQEYKLEFQKVYQRLFMIYPDTRSSYSDYSAYLRETSTSAEEDLIVLGFSGDLFLIEPATEKIVEGQYSELEAYGPFQVTRELMFPEELDEQSTGQQHG